MSISQEYYQTKYHISMLINKMLNIDYERSGIVL